MPRLVIFLSVFKSIDPYHKLRMIISTESLACGVYNIIRVIRPYFVAISWESLQLTNKLIHAEKMYVVNCSRLAPIVVCTTHPGTCIPRRLILLR